MDNSFEEATAKIKEKFKEIEAWFAVEYPARFLTIEAEYNTEISAFEWCVLISKDNDDWKYVGWTYTQKMHQDGFYLEKILDVFVSRTKRTINETFEAW